MSDHNERSCVKCGSFYHHESGCHWALNSLQECVAERSEQSLERKGDWFITVTGRQFWPLDPRPEDICIQDIAHALSMICRFGGHSLEFYSVAQHSVYVSHLVPPPMALEGLLHDGTEAYCGDMVRPLKREMPAYQMLENRIWLAIAKRYGMRLVMSESVKYFDNVMLITELRDLVHPSFHKMHGKLEERSYSPDEQRITPWSSRMAKEIFLKRFRELTAGGG